MVQIFDVTGVKKRAQNLAKLYDEILIAQRIGFRNKDFSASLF